MPGNDELKKYLDYDGLDYLIQRIPRTKIVVTFDDVFAGEDATCSLGTTSYTKTIPATEPYQLVFPITELGTWSIETSYLGDDYGTTVVVTGIGTTATGHVSYVSEIDGETVTPTDDITTWLKCANIEDASITTLADVLANRSLFETLLANSNACKYMARSTTWTGATVPNMTSDTTPSGVASASQTTSGKYPYYAFNGNRSTGTSDADFWQADTNNAWLQYKFDSSVIVTKFEISQKTAATRTLTVQLQGSNDGSSFTDISGASTSLSQSTPTQIVEFANTTAYMYYRFVCQSTDSYCIITYAQMYAMGITTSQDAMSLVGKYDYCSNALLSNVTWCTAIGNSDYFESVLNVKVPVMTSNTTPSGEVFGTNQDTGNSWMAFDGNDSTASTAASTGLTTGTLGYTFTKNVKITKITVKSNITSFDVQGYDGTNWITLHEATGANVTDCFINSNNYSKYRINIKGTTAVYWLVYTIQFYGRSSNEVLVPLVPTMTSNTTPSGECSASSEGTYYSNTRYAYFAFNGGTSGWVPNSTATNNYIQYTFPTAVKVNAVKMTVESNLSTRVFDRTFTILASNDNFVSDSHELGSVIFNSMTGSNAYTKEVSFVNNIAYTSYRLFCSDQLGSSGSWMLYTYGVQFYAKTVQTNIIHSAANDTIYMMDNGSQVPLCTTNSDGDGILDFTQFTDGTYTLYSSVAKDPTNLSNDYSKSIRITKTSYGCTTEAYLVPDTIKMLYWYGIKDSNLEDCTSENGWTPYSGMQWVLSTYNTNNVTLPGGTNKVNGIGTKNAVSASKLHIVYQNKGTNVNYFYYNVNAAKAWSGGSQISLTSTSLTYDTPSITSEINYLALDTTATGRADVYAFWYE